MPIDVTQKLYEKKIRRFFFLPYLVTSTFFSGTAEGGDPAARRVAANHRGLPEHLLPANKQRHFVFR
jgi:hypothetical protein